MDITTNIIQNSSSLGIAELFSGLAILVSIITLIYSSNQNKKINKKNMNKEFFDKVFLDSMMELPILVEKISNKVQIQSVCDKIIELIENVLDKAIFYKYFEEDFYNEIKKIFIELDEKIMEIPDFVEEGEAIDEKIFRKKLKGIHESMENLYDKLKKYYSKV